MVAQRKTKRVGRYRGGGRIQPTEPRTSSGTVNGFSYAIGEHAGYKEYISGMLRQYNEDRSSVNALGTTGLLVVVCDGHGGNSISQKVITELPPYLTSHINDETLKDNEQIKTVMKDGIALMVQQIAKLGYAAETVGTTCTVVVISPTSIVMGYLGDSPAVVMTKSGDLVAETIDHDFEHPGEVKRLNEMFNAMSDKDKAIHGRPIRFDGIINRLKGDLAMSRSLGDLRMLPYLSVEPDFVVVPRSANQRLVVGSDSIKEGVIQAKNARTGRAFARIGSALDAIDIVKEVTPILNKEGDATLEARVGELTRNRVNRFYYPGHGYQGDNTMIVVVELPDVVTAENNDENNGYFGKSNIYGGKRRRTRRKGRRGYNRN